MKFPLALLALLAVSACAASPNAIAPVSQTAPAAPSATATDIPAMTQPSQPVPPQAGIRATGTVRYQDLEGGFWGIVGDDGTRYDPMQLNPAFRKDGLRVRFEATADSDRMSTHMWGVMVTLTKIEPIE